MRKTPYFIAVIIAAIILLPASRPWFNPATASAHWWEQLTENEQGFYLIGYLTATYAWAQGIHQAEDFGDLSDATRHVYNTLAPASTYAWTELDTAISNYYRNNPDSTRPVWEVLHRYATDFRDNTQGGI